MNTASAAISEDQAHQLAKWGYYVEAGINPYEPLTHTEKLAALGGGDHQAAVAKWQKYHVEWLDGIKDRQHLRPIKIDGINGPAGNELLTYPRCDFPDFALDGPQQANWPTSCRHLITISYSESILTGFAGLSREKIDAAINVAHRQIESKIALKFQRKDNSYPNTRVFVKSAQLGRGVVADQYFPQNNCDYRSQGRRGSGRQMSSGYFSGTESHELGHACGAGHTNKRDEQTGKLAVMNPYIHQATIASAGAWTEVDIQLLLRAGYSRATGEPDDPRPNNDEITGRVTIEGKTYVYKSGVIEL